jgi:hypothetical protein
VGLLWADTISTFGASPVPGARGVTLSCWHSARPSISDIGPRSTSRNTTSNRCCASSCSACLLFDAVSVRRPIALSCRCRYRSAISLSSTTSAAVGGVVSPARRMGPSRSPGDVVTGPSSWAPAAGVSLPRRRLTAESSSRNTCSGSIGRMAQASAPSGAREPMNTVSATRSAPATWSIAPG